MNNGKLPPHRELGVLAPEIWEKHPSKVLIFSEDGQRVIGAGETQEEAYAQAEKSGVGGIWHRHYAPVRGENGEFLPPEKDYATVCRELSLERMRQSLLNDPDQTKLRDIVALGPEITAPYVGKHIVYSHEVNRVIGVGDTADEAFDQAEASGVKGGWHITYAMRGDELFFWDYPDEVSLP